MDSLDQVEEWRRLKELYARMNEGELEVVANEAYDLTEIARPLLKDEIARRGLPIQLRTERSQRPPVAPVNRDFSTSKLDLVVAGTYWELEDARKVKQMLDGAGVPCYWGQNNIENPEELKSSFEKGVDLTVREEDRSRVMAGIAQLFAGEPEEGEAGDCNFVCPKCHSPEIVFHELDPDTATFDWSCDACGHEWKDEGVEHEA
jgi:DNA-directed RNA polymerase subunit M/transcription elongation factor TFIIS